MAIEAFGGLKALLGFLIEQNSDDWKIPLGAVLGGMNIDFRVDGKPAEDAIWCDWKISIESLPQNEIFLKKQIFSCQETLTKTQVFMAAFHFLNDYYWRNNNAIRLEEVIKAINACIDDLEKDRKNPLWEVWLKYFEAEWQTKNEYSFD